MEIVQNGRAAATIDVATLNEQERTVDVVWSAGADVLRHDWWSGEKYIESLSMEPGHIRMDRFEAGMSLLDSHQSWSMDERLGYVIPESVRVENGLGYATVKISRRQRGEELWQDLLDGIPFPVSVGYRTLAYEKTEASESSLARFHAIDWEPQEISAVTVPADPAASSRSEEQQEATHQRVAVTQKRKGVDATRTKETDMPQGNATGKKPGLTNNPNGQRSETEEVDETETEEQELDENGDPVETDDGDDDGAEGEGAEGRSQPRHRQPAPARSQRSAPASDSEQATRTIAENAARRVLDAEKARASAIEAMGRRHNLSAEFVAKHLREGTELTQFRALVLDEIATRQDSTAGTGVVSGNGGTLVGPDHRQARMAAIQNAILHRYDPANNELTDHGREFRGMSLLDMARAEQEDRGERTRGLTKMEIATRAFHATSDFPIILQNVARVSIRAAYEQYPQTFGAMGRRTTVPDFKETTTLALSEGPKLLKVNEHGEYKRGTLRESAQSYKIATYGRIIGFTRQTLINDTLKAFTRIPQMYGNSIASLESDIVWDNLVSNQVMADGMPLFHASHANLLADPAPLTADTLGAMRTLMAKQQGDGSMLNLRPAFLVVAPELEFAAEKLLGNSAYFPTTVADATPDSLKRLQIIVEPRMSALNGGYAFMLVANPAQIDTFEYAYLEGEEGAYIETKEGWDVDGTEIKCRLDFGASVIDHKAFVLNTGVNPAG